MHWTEYVSLDNPLVKADLEATLTWLGPVMIDSDERGRRGRRHLRLHRDKAGYYVRRGRRGSGKQYLDRCKITFINGEPTLFSYFFEPAEFEIEYARRAWSAGVEVAGNPGPIYVASDARPRGQIIGESGIYGDARTGISQKDWAEVHAAMAKKPKAPKGKR
jgi:hypothetical protein